MNHEQPGQTVGAAARTATAAAEAAAEAAGEDEAGGGAAMRRLFLVRWQYGERDGVLSVWAMDERGARTAARTRLLGDTAKRFDPSRLVIWQVTGTRWVQVREE